jgi:L-xylulokinase
MTAKKYLMGIDCGSSVTKALIFDLDGNVVSHAASSTPHKYPKPRWVEQDPQALWRDCAQVVNQALENAPVSGSDIAAIGVTGRGDGIFLVDETGKPTRDCILSLDSRAKDLLEHWQKTGVCDKIAAVAGSPPYVASPSVLLNWLKAHEPDVLAKTRWFFNTKDWIKYRLTETITTDITEASSAFADMHTQMYASEIFRICDLADLEPKAPPIVRSTEIAGHVTPRAASETGLQPGTPVIAGLHDVDACAIGTGSTHPGQLSIVAGSFSINQIISEQPHASSEWLLRSYVEPGKWINIAASPASATNLKWFVSELCPLEVERAKQLDRSPYAFVNAEVESVLEDQTTIIFLPFLYGSVHGEAASAAFLGLKGWHTRAHVLKAVYEGVVFNHLTHIEPLKSTFAISEIRLTGGGSNSTLWSQMFADALGLPVTVTAVTETGALGAAMCAGVGVGAFESLGEAVSQVVRVARKHTPDAEQNKRLSSAYHAYRDSIQALASFWEHYGR